MIPESFKQDLLNRVDIVDVINSRVPLKKSGANWVACCPFHSEKTPSFTVSPTKQFYHCFGCGAHGNAIGFLMEYAGLGYVDAVRELAESDWDTNLPFTRRPVVQHIQPDEVVGIVDKTGHVADHTFITAMGLLRVGLDTLQYTSEVSAARSSIREKIDRILRT